MGYDRVYYKIYLSDDEGLVVVCLQYFDEKDYTEHKWLSEIRYETEGDAQEALDRMLSFAKKHRKINKRKQQCLNG